jgi:hypothetical protein
MARALTRDRSSSPLGFIIVCFVLAFLGAGYVFGLFQTIGYEDRTEKFESGRGISGGGTTVGPKLMFFFEGDTFFADYEAEIREGSLRIGILRTLSNTRGAHHIDVIERDSKGEVTFQIPETGFYRVYFSGSPSGNGYDISYSLRWGVRK